MNLRCVRLNKCTLFSDKHRRMASVKMGITSQQYSISRYENLTKNTPNSNSYIYFNKQDFAPSDSYCIVLCKVSVFTCLRKV
jgi:hypothetical protein